MARSKKTNKTSKTKDSTDSDNVIRQNDDEVTNAPEINQTDESETFEDAVALESDDIEVAVDEVTPEALPDDAHESAQDNEVANGAEEAIEAFVEPVEDEHALEEDSASLIDTPAEEPLEDVSDPPSDSADETERTTTDPRPAPAPIVQEQRSIFFPLVFGGIVAALLGFLAGQEGWIFQRPQVPDHTESVRALRADVDTLNVSLADLSSKVAALPGPVDISPLEGALTTIEERLVALEKRPIPSAGDAPDFSGAFSGAMEDFSGAFEDLKSQSETQQQEIARLLEEAAQARSKAAENEKATLARAALAQMQAAFDAGQPFSAPLSDLESSGLVDVPDVLKDAAKDGVATMAALQTEVPDAARSALSAARANSAGGEGVGGFLQRQLGLRSLEPREGDDPDAVLSRVEAAIKDNRLADALTETEQLPESAQAALGDWLARAEVRAAAVSAVESLLQSLPTN